MTKNTQLQDADVIILEADGSINEYGQGYGSVIRTRFASFNVNAILVSLVDPPSPLAELPPKPLILSGGMTEVTADIEWVQNARTFIYNTIKANLQDVREQAVPIFGICFGAQLIAECYSPGSVFYLDEPEFGISQITLESPAYPMFQGVNKEFTAYAFHYNQIKTQNVSILSYHHIGKTNYIQAFEIPQASTFGVQFHPEFHQSEMKALLRTYKDLIHDLNLNVDQIINHLPRIDNSIMLQNFYAHFSTFLNRKKSL